MILVFYMKKIGYATTSHFRNSVYRYKNTAKANKCKIKDRIDLSFSMLSQDSSNYSITTIKDDILDHIGVMAK